MSERTMTTLDFVINVLREHDRNLTTLSEKLDNIIETTISGAEKMEIQIITALIKSLIEQVSIQNQIINNLIKDYPTRKELEDRIQKLATRDSQKIPYY